MSWKWNIEPLSWKDKCSVCQQPLRVQGDSGIVIWTDRKHYHVWCLLDRLALASPVMASTSHGAARNSGESPTNPSTSGNWYP